LFPGQRAAHGDDEPGSPTGPATGAEQDAAVRHR
jgi:hypothetical protein